MEQKIKLPEVIRQRLFNYYQETQSLQARMMEVIEVSLQAKGIEGVYKGVDLSNGVVIVDVPDIMPVPEEDA